jgi:hypothetical protein
MLRLTAMILWPAFLIAIIAEGFFFSLFDPDDLAFAGAPIEMSRMAAYTLGFFFFWFFCALASAMTCYLVRLPGERQPPF